MSFALLFALVMMLFPAGAATAAEEGENPASLVDEAIAGLSGGPTGDPAPTTEAAGNGAATTTPSATDAATGTGSAGDSSSSPSSSAPATSTVGPEQSSTADEPVEGPSSVAGTSTGSVPQREMAEENPCLPIVEQLVADLGDLLGENAESIDGLLDDPESLADVLAGLEEETAAEVEALLTQAADDIEKCLSALQPEPQPTEPQPPIAHPSPDEPAGYENCDEVRAAGAAPIHAGQPGYAAHLDSDNDGIGCEDGIVVTQPAAHTGAGQLAYTGVTVQPMIAWGAALVLSGGWLLRSARRRA